MLRALSREPYAEPFNRDDPAQPVATGVVLTGYSGQRVAVD